MGKKLIAYFSHSGNTRELANQIYNIVKGDIFEIKTVNPYPADYNTVVEMARKELDTNFRPKLANEVKDIDSYDEIIICYPNWWNTMPMGVFSFLEKYDFSGKTIIPFCTHEGSELGRSVNDLKKHCQFSKVVEGLAIRGGRVTRAQPDITEWFGKYLLP